MTLSPSLERSPLNNEIDFSDPSLRMSLDLRGLSDNTSGPVAAAQIVVDISSRRPDGIVRDRVCRWGRSRRCRGIEIF